MAAPVSVTTSATVITAANPSARFIDIENNSAQVVYLSWDGTVPTVANGFPLPVNGSVYLTGRERCDKGVQAIVAATTSDVRVQVG